MPDQTLVRFCAPTLAGMKVGNLFTVDFTDAAALHAEVARKNARLNGRGIYVRILRMDATTALIYVYRKSQLEKALQSAEIQAFLARFGYPAFDIPTVLATIRQHLQTCNFPHEIGVILGYPLHDIQAFISDTENKSCYVGCWKAYSNPEYARMIFEKYQKCTRIYLQEFSKEHVDIIKLTVAC